MSGNIKETISKKQPFLIQQNINATINEQHTTPHKKTSFYSRFDIPPNLQVCLLHQEATSFGSNKQQDDTKCPCCNQHLKRELSFNCPISQIYKINEPVGFYFTFIKMMILTLGFMIVIPGIYSIVQITKLCLNQKQNCDYIYGVPIPKLKAYYTQVSLLLNASILLVQYIIIAFLFYWNTFIHEKMRLYHKKASDQHIFLTGIDHNVIEKDKILKHLKDYQIQEIIYTHKIGRYLKLFAEKYQIQALKKKVEYQGHHGKTNKINKLNVRLRKIDNQIIPIKNRIQLGDDIFLRTDKVFIKFANRYQKLRFQQQYKQGLLSTIYSLVCSKSRLKIQNCNLYIERLGDPREIIWQNLEISSMKRILLILLNNIILLCILASSYYFVVQLNFLQQDNALNSDVFISVSLSVSIQVVNVILSAIIDYTTQKQGRYTVTGLSSAVLVKKVLVYFINTTLIPFSMFVLKSFRPIQEDQMRNIFTLFIFCNIISPIIAQFLQIGFLIKLYKRYKIKKLGKKCLKTQISANKIFQKMNFNLEQRYGVLCQRMLNCVFYAAIFPIAALITALGLVLTYLLSKYILLKHSSIPRHSFRLGILIVTIFLFQTHLSTLFPCIYAIGYVVNLIVYQQTPTYNINYSIIMASCTLLISIIFLIFGNKIAKNKIKIQLKDISGIYVSEEITYKDLNPTTFWADDNEKSQNESSKSIMKNLMEYSALHQGFNFSRLSRSTLSSNLKKLIIDQHFKDN